MLVILILAVTYVISHWPLHADQVAAFINLGASLLLVYITHEYVTATREQVSVNREHFERQMRAIEEEKQFLKYVLFDAWFQVSHDEQISLWMSVSDREHKVIEVGSTPVNLVIWNTGKCHIKLSSLQFTVQGSAYRASYSKRQAIRPGEFASVDVTTEVLKAISTSENLALQMLSKAVAQHVSVLISCETSGGSGANACEGWFSVNVENGTIRINRDRR